MPARHSRRRRAIALVPAALLCTLVSPPMGGGGAAPGAEPASVSRPLPSVPTEALEAPASLSQPGVLVAGGQGRVGRPTVSVAVSGSASVSGIPGAALSAYQRAETVINVADQSCNLPWQLLAAVGRVESGHGTANGNSLDDEGLATPGIYGIALNGTRNTQAISDTDAGQYDRDARWDRAVGPMQFIPSTWSVVGVDGDNDGKRNPQDIDDAALAAAVYLCSGKNDLSTDAGRRAAIFRYNHSHDYVDLVLSLMEAYLDVDFMIGSSTTSYADTSGLAPEIARSRSGESSLRAALVRSARHDAELVEPPGGPGSDPGIVGEPDPEVPQEPELPEVPQEPELPEVPQEPELPDVTPEPELPDVTPDPEPELPDVTPDPEPEPEPITEEEAIEVCLVVVGATDVTVLEQLGLLDGFTTCMEELGFLQWSAP